MLPCSLNVYGVVELPFQVRMTLANDSRKLKHAMNIMAVLKPVYYFTSFLWCFNLAKTTCERPAVFGSFKVSPPLSAIHNLHSASYFPILHFYLSMEEINTRAMMMYTFIISLPQISRFLATNSHERRNLNLLLMVSRRFRLNCL